MNWLKIKDNKIINAAHIESLYYKTLISTGPNDTYIVYLRIISGEEIEIGKYDTLKAAQNKITSVANLIGVRHIEIV